MQFGPSMDKSNIVGLVRATKWNDFLELNRMAFGPALPKNSESRALGVAMRMIRKHYPNIEWVVSFADGTQCGDGTIYRASGFHLTGINKNKSLWFIPGLGVISEMTIKSSPEKYGLFEHSGGGAHIATFAKAKGGYPLPGFQLRYLYFINPAAKDRLTVPILPFSKIDELGAAMYRGKKRAGSSDNAASTFQAEEGGASPTPALQTNPT